MCSYELRFSPSLENWNGFPNQNADDHDDSDIDTYRFQRAGGLHRMFFVFHKGLIGISFFNGF